MSPSNNHSPRALDDQLLVDFPTRRRRPTVRFVPQCTVFPIRYTLTMISDKQELWYLKRDVDEMKLERTSDAIALARTLLSPSDEDLKEGGIHVRQAIGLEKAANPIEAQKRTRAVLLHRMAVLRLQEEKDDEELCQISQVLSSQCTERAHTLAKAWIDMDK